jgi:hypothetical protein
MPLTSQNMSRVLTENARGSSDISGLVNDIPSADPSVGQGGNVAGKVEAAPTGRGGGGRIDQGTFDLPTDTSTPTKTATVNAPGGGDGGLRMTPLGATILGGGAIGLGTYLGRKIPAMGGSPSGSIPGSPTPGGSVPPPADPGAGVNTGEVDYTNLTPESVRTGDRFDTEPDPLASAINRAVEPSATGPRTMIGPTSPSGVTTPAAVPGTTPQEAGDRIIPRPPGMPDRTKTSLNIPTPPNVAEVHVRPPTPRVVIRGLHLY